MDAAHQQDVASVEHPAQDRWELSLWPVAAAAADEVIRSTSQTAAYWHDSGFARWNP